jgi:hypothetical protein
MKWVMWVRFDVEFRGPGAVKVSPVALRYDAAWATSSGLIEDGDRMSVWNELAADTSPRGGTTRAMFFPIIKAMLRRTINLKLLPSERAEDALSRSYITSIVVLDAILVLFLLLTNTFIAQPEVSTNRIPQPATGHNSESVCSLPIITDYLSFILLSSHLLLGRPVDLFLLVSYPYMQPVAASSCISLSQ